MQRFRVVRAIQVTCPHCGARLSAGTAEVVRCEYCGTEARVQRRTRMLERVMPMPAAANRPIKIAVQTKSKLPLALLLVVLGVPLAGAGFGVYMAVTKTREAGERRVAVTRDVKTKAAAAKSAYVAPEDRPPTWQGMNGSIIVDVDKNQTVDIIGRARQVHRGDVIHVMALDGATGKRMWLSDVIGTYSETYRSPLANAGDVLLFATDRGQVHGLETSTGKRRWQIALPERASYFCTTAAGELAVVTADEMRRSIGKVDGALGAPVAVAKSKRGHDDAECPRLPTDGEMGPPHPFMPTSIEPALGNKLAVSPALIAEGPGGRVIGATPNKGTRVPLLIAIDDKGAERWRARAAGDSLAGEGAPRRVIVGDAEVCAEYSESSGTKVACFSLADGKRLWDAPLPPFAFGLVIAGRSLLISGARGLESRDLLTGATRW
jgi:hypothetical protein